METGFSTPRHSLFEILWRRRVVAFVTFAILSILSLLYISQHKTTYAALCHVVLVSDPAGRDPTETGADMPTIATGSTVLLAVQHRLHLTWSINDLRRAVTARVAPRSSLMTIAVQVHDRQMAINVDNAIADTFADFYFKLGATRNSEVVRRLSGDVQAATSGLKILNRRLEAAAAGSAYVGSQASLDASASHLGELEESRGLALGQSVTDNANLRADLLQPGTTQKAARHEILANNVAYHATEMLIAKDSAQYTTTRAGVTGMYPGIPGFRDKIAKETRVLRALREKALVAADAYSPLLNGRAQQTSRDEAATQGDRARLAAFDVQIEALKRQFDNSASRPSIGALRAARDAVEAQLQALSLRLTNAQANGEEANSLGAVVVVDRATDARPTLIGTSLLLSLGLVASLLLAVVATYLAELFVPRLIDSTDAERIYGQPVIVKLR